MPYPRGRPPFHPLRRDLRRSVSFVVVDTLIDLFRSVRAEELARLKSAVRSVGTPAPVWLLCAFR